MSISRDDPLYPSVVKFLTWVSEQDEICKSAGGFPKEYLAPPHILWTDTPAHFRAVASVCQTNYLITVGSKPGEPKNWEPHWYSLSSNGRDILLYEAALSQSEPDEKPAPAPITPPNDSSPAVCRMGFTYSAEFPNGKPPPKKDCIGLLHANGPATQLDAEKLFDDAAHVSLEIDCLARFAVQFVSIRNRGEDPRITKDELYYCLIWMFAGHNRILEPSIAAEARDFALRKKWLFVEKDTSYRHRDSLRLTPEGEAELARLAAPMPVNTETPNPTGSQLDLLEFVARERRIKFRTHKHEWFISHNEEGSGIFTQAQDGPPAHCPKKWFFEGPDYIRLSAEGERVLQAATKRPAPVAPSPKPAEKPAVAPSWRVAGLAPALVTLAEQLEKHGWEMEPGNLKAAIEKAEGKQPGEGRYPSQILRDNEARHGKWILAWIDTSKPRVVRLNKTPKAEVQNAKKKAAPIKAVV